jgi:hypothetical protein
MEVLVVLRLAAGQILMTLDSSVMNVSSGHQGTSVPLTWAGVELEEAT